MRRLRLALFVIVGLPLGACRDEGLPPGGVDLSMRPDLSCRPAARDKVDILFMLDDSGGTSPRVEALAARFPNFIQQLDGVGAAGHEASYHIGVVTSDLGVPASSGITCGASKGAKLQPIGSSAPAGCPRPTGNFLIYDQQDPTNNNFTGALADTFSCMAEVGDRGCGFEAPLEAVYRALHDPIPENTGFLREDALLVVFLITDEDDCSVDETSDLFNPAITAYGPLNSFRCTRFGIYCDGALLSDTPQSYSSCTPATPAQGGKLTDLQKYIAFFTQPKSNGGVKADPRDVVLATIDGPSSPFSTSTANDTSICGPGTSSCTVLDHSCSDSMNAGFFADPAVRINTLVDAVPNHLRASVCETDDASAVEALAQRINSARLEDVCPP